MKPPATIILGEVVRLREKLDWFERLPLFGKRIVVTRAREQADALGSRLAELGAGVISLPTIEIRPPGHPRHLKQAVARLATYHWLIFTSANAVRHFIACLDEGPHDLRKLRARVCAIGPATRAAVEALHLKVDLMPKEYVAESLLEAFSAYDLTGKRVLLPRAAVARDLVPTELARRGAHVDVVEAYRTVTPEHLAEHAREILASRPDCLTFTSSSTVRNLVEAAGAEALRGIPAASIGPITTQTARELGVEVAAEAKVFNVEGLVDAVLGLLH
jgi:uroporphyrinogen III methyltransferase / synthase